MSKVFTMLSPAKQGGKECEAEDGAVLTKSCDLRSIICPSTLPTTPPSTTTAAATTTTTTTTSTKKPGDTGTEDTKNSTEDSTTKKVSVKRRSNCDHGDYYHHCVSVCLT